MKRICVTAVFVVAVMAAADELEADWIAQDGAASTNGTHEAWCLVNPEGR